jgi:hypothetical protein
VKKGADRRQVAEACVPQWIKASVLCPNDIRRGWHNSDTDLSRFQNDRQTAPRHSAAEGFATLADPPKGQVLEADLKIV